MPANKEVFQCISDAVDNALRERFGRPGLPGNAQIPAQVAVATLQLALRYFADTGAPKAVVFDFFLELMGVKGNRATLEEKEGKLLIVPPKPSLIIGGKNGG
jgi:hypothetical protein